MDSEHIDRVAKLERHLEDDPRAVAWALKRTADYAELEAARKACCTRLYELANDAERKFEDAEVALLARTIRVCATYDRANACLLMRLTREDPACPSGFVWADEAALGALAKVPAWSTDGVIATQQPSVNKRYAWFLRPERYVSGETPEEVATLVAELTAACAPRWMVERLGVELPVFEPTEAEVGDA